MDHEKNAESKKEKTLSMGVAFYSLNEEMLNYAPLLSLL